MIVIVELAERYTFYGASLGPFQVCLRNRNKESFGPGSVHVKLTESLPIHLSLILQNYAQNPLPEGSTAGNVPGGGAEGVPGALNKGQPVATALTTFFSFFCYVTPLLGAYISDTYLGRYKTICLFTGVYIAGLAILVGTSTPAGIASGAGFPGFVVARE